MKIKCLRNVTMGAFVLVLFASIFFCKTAIAKPDFSSAAQGLEISPTLIELNAVRGNTYALNINVRNITAADLLYSSYTSDFTAADESGSPLIANDEKLSNTISVKKWVDTVPSFELESRQLKTVTVRIVVPGDAEPGGHYGAIMFTGSSVAHDNQSVSLSASAGVLVLIRVDGEIVEKASLASFYSVKNDKQVNFFETGPIQFVARIKNDGNIHIKPSGSIALINMFGEVVQTLPVNGDQSNVLPNSIRRLKSEHNKKWMFGRYTANLALGFGNTGQVIIGSTSFWVIPYRAIIICLIAVVVVLSLLIKSIKVYNNHIIKKSKNENTIKKKNN